MTQNARLRIPVVLLLLGAVLLWIASRMVWVDVVAFNDQSGEARRSLTGAQWQPALVPLAVGALAAVAAVALVRGTGARVVGAVIALLGLATGALLFSTVGGVDQDRVHSTVTGEEELGRTNAGPGTAGAQAVPEWSEITEISTRSAGPVLTGAGALALVAAGAVPMIWPTRRVQRDDRYVTPGARRGDPEAGEDTGDTGRDLWQELDDGRDPTG
ncbi:MULTISPECIES: TIGR02234 family membrane protein [Dietzia]|uniref:TIGR02234 family membrane protein n=4 Tax=Dietzia TaxID=37914 RepID=A0ABP4UNI6_9ACTN|nr:TIGR02234 family membrane protein [Dietzia cercidiphylli]MBB1037208.1 TIGR02234 family membrane protein [Dietzia natronolimnaea]MBB1041126.1 TIGR02234 family membrane protein [Dietzia sp. Cai40]MBB1044291.1 TIGR02234 family membrane protein [Dietzia sp. DQ11-44]MBB1053013.1 TIGR02234 family membrane protein [Dietzia sp. B44]MBC7295355.1 TIGR02234 family membrane protein [Dietzia sp.]